MSDQRSSAPEAHLPRPSIFQLNPIWVRGLRARVRMRHLLSWGVVAITVVLFISLMTYMTVTQRDLGSPEDAARSVLPGLIIVQAVIMMMAGTGAVASGVARERDERLLDYQRMTPMSPTARIIGYLFGLPAREYVLFALTLPFVAGAVIVSGFSLLTLLHFYAVFFTSVWVYHMTALVAGMVAPKPRAASLLSVGMVVILYFVLPNLSRIGLTFFEFLTIRPTLFGLVHQELPEHLRGPVAASGIDSFRDVPFFGGHLHPTVYTMLVQGFVLVTMFTIVHRRWRNETSHLLSKKGGFAVFLGVTIFLLGSVWAIVVQEDVYLSVFEQFRIVEAGQRSPESLLLLLYMAALIIGMAYLLITSIITPERHTVLEGWRRARKHGRTHLNWNSDAACGLPASAAMLATFIVSGALVLWLVVRSGTYFNSAPGIMPLLLVGAVIIGSGLFVQGLRERFGTRVFAVTLFLIWMVPFFTMMILIAAFERAVIGAYAGLPFPPISIGITLGHALESAAPLEGMDPQLLPTEIHHAGPALSTVAGTALLTVGILMQIAAVFHRRRLHGHALRSEPVVV